MIVTVVVWLEHPLALATTEYVPELTVCGLVIVTVSAVPEDAGLNVGEFGPDHVYVYILVAVEPTVAPDTTVPTEVPLALAAVAAVLAGVMVRALFGTGEAFIL